MDGRGHKTNPRRRAEVRDRGHGDGHHAVRAANGAVALAQGRHDYIVNPQVIEADGDGADVHDGVDGSHLVEQHRVGRRAVRLGLRAGELAEDGKRDVLRAPCETGCLDNGADVRERAVRMVVTMGVLVLMLVTVLVLVAMLVLVLVAMLVLVLVLVAMLVLVLVAVAVPLVGFFPVLAKEPCHVVVVVLVLAVELHVEVAGAKAALCHAAHTDLVPVDGQGVQRGQEPLLARAQVQ